MSTVVERLRRFNQEHAVYMGKVYALLSALFNASHIIIIRSFPKGFNPYRIANNEMIFSLLYVWTLNDLLKGPPLHPKEPSKANLLLIRAILGVPGFTCAVVGAYLIPSKVYVVVSNCNIIFATILGFIVHKQFPSVFITFLIFLFIAGVVIMTDPELIGLHTAASSAPVKDCSPF